MTELDQIKQRQREMWTIGDYASIAEMIEEASAAAVEHAGVESGIELLDVATGTGNAAIIAARLGALVTGLDLTPKLLGIAAERARDAGLELELIEGDAEDLPFADDSFDRVTSVFGVMFAPNQQKAADELMRVCRPEGRIVTCAWTPTGLNGKKFALVGGAMPPPPDGFQPPVLWGTEERIEGLFSGAGIEFRRQMVVVEADSADELMEHYETSLGPILMAKQALESVGEWGALREQLAALYSEANQATDGTMHVEAEYLLAVITPEA